jgi:hypothetical protein
MKNNRFIYDQLRDIYFQICKEEVRKKPAPPIKKKKPSYERPSSTWKYGSGYADQGQGGTKVRTTYKDWDESYDLGTHKKSFKQFREDAGNRRMLTKQDKKNLEFMKQVFLAAKNIDDFWEFIDFINTLQDL